MYKVKTSCGLLKKTFFIEEILITIQETKGSEYKFFLGYKPISHIDFLKMFLTETRNVEKYIKLESLLNPRIDLIDYQKNRK